jgi:hypothetical protein
VSYANPRTGADAYTRACDGRVRNELTDVRAARWCLLIEAEGGRKPMNWRKGLLQFWLILSLCWIAAVGVYVWKQEPGISSSQSGYEIASSPEKQNENEIVGSLNAELAKRYVAYVLLPPLITLLLGLLGAWVVSSFEHKGT